MDHFSFLNTIDSEFIEELYQRYLKYPDSIEASWRSFFQGFDFANAKYLDSPKQNNYTTNSIAPETSFAFQDEVKVINMIDAYRKQSHLLSSTNPLKIKKNIPSILNIENFGLVQNDLDRIFHAGKILGLESTTLREIINTLDRIYKGSIGFEYMYIDDSEEAAWIQQWINNNFIYPKLSKEEKQHIFIKLSEAVLFENFLNIKFVGQKRFSVEGGESLIPALDELIHRSIGENIKEIVIGMAHRGRLNVLSNIFNKPLTQLFCEFEGKDYEDFGFSGDVKYHLGLNNSIKNEKGSVEINLVPNPSHLEAVDAVVEGVTRAKAENDYKNDYGKILPVLIHGDAAIAGQGIVYEVIQMMNLKGYTTGGTIHLVVNNQVGFTADPEESRSSIYCTDIAKAFQCPVLHVNSDDVEAVIYAIRFALDYRLRFKKDVFIDILGYRKYGHNEGDEPRFTQPKLYNLINNHQNPKDIYAKQLISEGIIDETFIEKNDNRYKSILEDNFEKAKNIKSAVLTPFMQKQWEDFPIASIDKMLQPVNTQLPKDTLIQLAQTITTLPKNKKFFNKIERLLKQRQEAITKNSFDWGMCELLAYASILSENHNIRLSGEDVGRGTFSHRQAIIKVEDTEENIILLNNVNKKAQFRIYNSLLSEYAALGFDYGYAMASPNDLIIWEAQFGDFANGAQIIFDQYLSAAEDKWKIQNGLVMLLPHGFEGQGAEHSSARIERYMDLCANGNMFIVNATIPSNLYHALRRQIHTDYRKPLIVFSPKSLLRHPSVVSSLEELAEGHFQEIIDEIDPVIDPKHVSRLIFCSGRVYYDLVKKRDELNKKEIAIIRIEQLYPLKWELIDKIIKKYSKRKEICWVQEEPENMGAWSYILRTFRKYDINGIKNINPEESPAPSPGPHEKFNLIMNRFYQKVFNL